MDVDDNDGGQGGRDVNEDRYRKGLEGEGGSRLER